MSVVWKTAEQLVLTTFSALRVQDDTEDYESIHSNACKCFKAWQL